MAAFHFTLRQAAGVAAGPTRLKLPEETLLGLVEGEVADLGDRYCTGRGEAMDWIQQALYTCSSA